jgi:hypothetical protein
MGREQAARRQADARIGLALGDGIARGLEVGFRGNIAPGGRPAAMVKPGVAVNRLGATLCLTQPVTLALDRAAPPGTDSVACLFGDCAPLADGDYVADAGLYLLTISPAFTSEGRAQVSGMGDAAPRCALDVTVEAVQFRLLEIPQELYAADPGRLDLPAPSPARPDFRNRVAYEAFGTGVRAGWPADLLGNDAREDDLLEKMRGHGLGDAEVPLALIAFNSGGHVFTDNWSVRRPIFARDPASVVSTISEPRRAGLGRAMFRQFQDELDDIADFTTTRAQVRFAFLPTAWSPISSAASRRAGPSISMRARWSRCCARASPRPRSTPTASTRSGSTGSPRRGWRRTPPTSSSSRADTCPIAAMRGST